MMRRNSSIAIDWRLNDKGSLIYDRVHYAIEEEAMKSDHDKSEAGEDQEKSMFEEGMSSCIESI